METIIGDEFIKKVIPLIDNAVHSVKIINYDWRWYVNDVGYATSQFNQAIIRAIGRGIGVFAILEHDSIIKRISALGASARKINLPRLVHAKVILIDDKICVVGSHNLTEYAFTKNFEVSLFFEDTDIAKQLDTFFQNLWLL